VGDSLVLEKLGMVMYDIALGDDVLFFDFILFIASDNICHTGAFSKQEDPELYIYVVDAFRKSILRHLKIMDTLHCKGYGGRHIKLILWQQKATLKKRVFLKLCLTLESTKSINCVPITSHCDSKKKVMIVCACS
jgi:hypothetical protein